MIRFVYDLDIVIEAMENQDYKDASKMIKEIQEDLRILSLDITSYLGTSFFA